MTKVQLTAFILTLGFSSVFSQPYPEFEEVYGFTVDGLGSISEMVYNDINGDGMPEVLIRSGQEVILYSLSGDSVFWETVLDTGSYYGILLADVNRDSIVDVVTASYGGLNPYSEEGVVLDVYDGIFDDSPIRTSFENRAEDCSRPSQNYSCNYYHSFGITALAAADYNGDGYNELVFSYGYKLFVGDMIYYGVTRSFGLTRSYHSFPDSVQWTSDNLSYAPVVMPSFSNTYTVSNCRCSYDDIGSRNTWPPGRHNAQTIGLVSLQGFDAEGDTAFSLINGNGKCSNNSIDTQCDDRWREDVATSYHTLHLALLGDLDTTNYGVEILIDYDWSNKCDWIYSGNPPDEGHKLRLYSVSDLGEVILLWERDLEADYTFVSSAAFPGLFFGLRVDSMYVFSGADGQIQATLGDAPAGLRRFESPNDRFDDFLTLIDSNHVTVYRLAPSIALESPSEEPGLLPQSISLGAPYPNPFNAQLTIPVTLKPGSHLKVEVVDILGRTADRIHDGPVSRGFSNIVWKANGFSSGVYFITAYSGGSTATTRALLLK